MPGHSLRARHIGAEDRQIITTFGCDCRGKSTPHPALGQVADPCIAGLAGRFGHVPSGKEEVGTYAECTPMDTLHVREAGSGCR